MLRRATPRRAMKSSMHKPQQGICCSGCPHRAAYIVCKEALGRRRGRVICGDAGCAAVGEVRPAATACPGGMARLLPRYNQPVPTGTADQPGSDICVRFAPDALVAKAPSELSARVLAQAGACAVLAVNASGKPFLAHDAIEDLAGTLEQLGYEDVTVLDPFDTLRCADVLADIIAAAGAHAIVFSSPCAQLLRGNVPEPAEVDRYTCVGCQRCVQITACPALSFRPPAAFIDPEACTGCDLCGDYCRTHVILSPRGHMTQDEIRRQRFEAALGR